LNEILNVALSALGAVVSGYVLFVIKSHHADEKEYRAGLSKQLKELGDKDDDLGTDIQVTRGALDWLCGTLNKDRPNYGHFR